MKNKYQRMSKDEKKILIQRYKKTEKGNYLLTKLRNVLFCGIILYGYAVYLVIAAKNIWAYIGAASLFVIACTFTISSIRLRIKYLNRFAIKGK